MTNTPEYIRETLELYDRGELDPSRLLEVQALLRSDPAWQAAWRSFRSESAGIRLNRFKTNLSILESLEAELKDPEKKTVAGGDPGAVFTSSPESNHIKQAPETSLPENMEETFDRNTSEGIRFSRLHQTLNGLKAEEKKTAGPRPAGSRILGIRRILMGAIAATMTIFILKIVTNKTEKVNGPILTYLDTHLYDYIIHSKERKISNLKNDSIFSDAGYNLFVIKEYEKAIPHLEQNWLAFNDTTSLFYLKICLFTVNKKKYVNKQNYYDTIKIYNPTLANKIHNLRKYL